MSALGWLRLSPEERERQAAAARHPFAKVSLRGKAAWLICCLEQALLAWGLDAEEGEPGSWYPVLALLWKFPELPEERVDPALSLQVPCTVRLGIAIFRLGGVGKAWVLVTVKKGHPHPHL